MQELKNPDRYKDYLFKELSKIPRIYIFIIILMSILLYSVGDETVKLIYDLNNIKSVDYMKYSIRAEDLINSGDDPIEILFGEM